MIEGTSNRVKRIGTVAAFAVVLAGGAAIWIAMPPRIGGKDPGCEPALTNDLLASRKIEGLTG